MNLDFSLQVGRPEAPSPALSDSPVGLAAWIIEKYYAWSDRHERVFDDIFDLGRLIDEVMLYLVTDISATSLRARCALICSPGAPQTETSHCAFLGWTRQVVSLGLSWRASSSPTPPAPRVDALVRQRALELVIC